MLACYDRRRGWLITRGSIIKGGRHGEPALIEGTIDQIVKVLEPEIRAGLRSMQKMWSRR